jgi:predicted ATPase with chaperone activity
MSGKRPTGHVRRAHTLLKTADGWTAQAIGAALDVTRVYSVADALPTGTPLIQHRPFRAPHHTVSHAGLVGGGNYPKPGEISLAHRGVLFLDELPEFAQRTLEVMRQPLEDHVVTISHAKQPYNTVMSKSAEPLKSERRQ